MLFQLFALKTSAVPFTPARKREYMEYTFTKFRNF